MADQDKLRLRSRKDLERAIRDGRIMGASMMAGKQFGSKTEREGAGRVMYQLADVLDRAIAAGFLDPIGMGADD